MFRALAVLLASAAVAYAPAAPAATPAASSHKPAHAKGGHAQEAPSKKAKLRRASSEEDSAPTKGRKAHAGAHAEARSGAHAATASASSKRRHAATEEADAAPKGKAGKHHATAVSDEEADTAPKTKKVCTRHGKKLQCKQVAVAEPKGEGAKARKASDEEADATPKTTKVCTGKGKKRRCTVEAAAEPAKGKHGHAVAEAEETPRESEHGLLIRSDVRTTKACVAAHVREHGRPKGARARLALQRECAKEVEAARRKAEEELAIRTWTPPHGPLIYQGALPHGSIPAVPSVAVSEPPPTAPVASLDATATPSSTSIADAATAMNGPAKGSATVVQPPQPAQVGFFATLFGHGKHAKPTETGPAPTEAGLIGSDETRLKAQLGEPELMRVEGEGAMWTYRLPGCALYVFLGRDPAAGGALKVKGAQAGPLKRGGVSPEVDVCLKSARS